MYNQLSNEEKILVNSEISNGKKSVGIAYLLWFFLSSLGIHRIYLGRKMSGFTMLLLNVLGWLTLVFAIGFIFFTILALWVLVDLFLIPGMVRQENDKLQVNLTQRVLNERAVS